MKKSLLKSSYVVSLMTILSRVAGLVREIVFASVFGASGAFDAYVVAARLPNLMRRLFAEGAFAQAFVPVLSEYRQKRSYEEAKLFIARMAGILSLTLFVVTVIAIIAAPLMIMIFSPGFTAHATKFALATSMLRITFPYLLFISLTAFAGSILNSYDVFSVPAVTPAILNISLILAAIFLAPYFSQPVKALAWGLFIAGILQLSFQIPFLKRLKLLPKPKICWRDSGVKRVLKLMVPAMLGVSVVQIGVLIDTMFASFLKSGSITWLYFSDRLYNFPLAVFGIAVATVILPHLSRKHAEQSTQEFSASLDWSLRCILIIGIPSAVGIFMLSGPILATFFQHQKFHAFDVIMTTRSLRAFAVGLPAFMIIKVLATGFYSRQNIKTPVKIATLALVINIICNIILIVPLAHAGLALATSIAATTNASLLFYKLRKRDIYQPQQGWLRYLIQLGCANIAMILFLFFFTGKLSSWLAWSWYYRIWRLLPLLAGAVVIYLLMLFISGMRFKHFKFVD